MVSSAVAPRLTRALPVDEAGRNALLRRVDWRFLLPDANPASTVYSGSDGLLDWMQVGFLPLLLPRYFVERLGFKTWDEVASFIARQDNVPWWWMLDWDDLHSG